MKSHYHFSIMLAAAIASQPALAEVKGQCTFESEKLLFIDGHAALGPDPFEDKLKVPMLWLTTVALDHDALAAAKYDEIDDAVGEQTFDKQSAKLELRFNAAGTTVEGLQLYIPPGNNRSISGNEVGKLQLKIPVATRANGQFILDDDDLHCDLQFDLPMNGIGPPAIVKPWGIALPAGGGEPGKAFLALHRAVLASDVETMLVSVTREKADKMREARAQPEFAETLKMIKAFEPAVVRIISGRVNGDRAELQIDGKDSDGTNLTGVVKLLLEEGRWCVEGVSTKSKVSQ